MTITYKYDCKDVDWVRVREITKKVNMAYVDPEIHKQAFENSYAVVFAYDEDKLIGFGRVISDGVQQAALYNISIDPKYQGRRIGTTIVGKLLEKVPGCNVILFASPGKEEFYIKNDFNRMLTGMAKFTNAEEMIEKGFVE